MAVDRIATSSTGQPYLGRSTLDIQASVSVRRHVLVLSGELDIASADQLEAMVRRICAKAKSEVVLDLSRLTFMDSCGLRAVLRAGEVCEEHGHEFALVPGPENVQRVFELARLTERLPFEPGPA